jgi:hypothetical protein
MLMAATLALSGALVAGTAQAQSTYDQRTGWTANDQAQACYEQARQQVLRGEDLKRFMDNCTSQVARQPAPADLTRDCDERTKLLRGEEKRMAMQNCMGR